MNFRVKRRYESHMGLQRVGLAMTKPLLAILLLLPLSEDASAQAHQWQTTALEAVNVLFVAALVTLVLKLWDVRPSNRNRPQSAVAIWGRFQAIVTITIAIVAGLNYLGESPRPIDQILVGALCIASFASTKISQPHKVWTWHFIALGFNTAVIVSIYYWVWNDDFALRYFWYAALIGAVFFTTIESIFISRSGAETND